MQTTSAALGAWTLGGSEPATDARTSIALVGSRTTVPGRAAPSGPDPIASARRWMSDPERRAAIGPALAARADASLLVAERWLREIDVVAHGLVDGALDAGEGELDPKELRRIDGMVEVLTMYSERMRDLLDPAGPAPDANERIAAGLEASRAGGLPAFVAAL